MLFLLPAPQIFPSPHVSFLQVNKKEHHHGKAACPSSGMAMVWTSPPREPLCDGLVKGAVEGFYLIQMTRVENELFS